MRSLLRLAQLLAMLVWVGGLVFFAFVMAPVAFHVLPSTHEAGLVVGAALRVFDRVSMVCGAVFLAATAGLFAQAPYRLKGRYELEFLLAGIMLVATAYIQWNVIPSMDADRRLAGGDVMLVAENHPARVHFDKLHKRSEQVEGAVLLLGLVVVLLMSREQMTATELRG